MAAATSTWDVKLSDNTWVTATGATARSAMAVATSLLAKQGRTDVRVVSASRKVQS